MASDHEIIRVFGRHCAIMAENVYITGIWVVRMDRRRERKKKRQGKAFPESKFKISEKHLFLQKASANKTSETDAIISTLSRDQLLHTVGLGLWVVIRACDRNRDKRKK